MKYSEVTEKVAELREMADFLEQNGHKLPYTWFSPTMNVSLTDTDYVRGENGEYETIINEDKTKQNIRKFLQAVGSCEKDYRDDRLRITRKFTYTDRDMIVGTVDRSIACKKVVTGKKFVKEHLVPSKFEEEYEWKCDENISLLKLVQ